MPDARRARPFDRYATISRSDLVLVDSKDRAREVAEELLSSGSTEEKDQFAADLIAGRVLLVRIARSYACDVASSLPLSDLSRGLD